MRARSEKGAVGAVRAVRAVVVGALLAGVLAGCGPELDFSEEALSEVRLGVGLPRGFVLGVATAPHQIEGGSDNDWTDWEKGAFPDGTPHIQNGDRVGLAVDSWRRWPEDVAALGWLGANGYRLGLEWSRLSPEEGAWDAAAVANYRAQLLALRARGITPFVTLSHFTLPRWVAARGGWEWEGAVPAFEAHVQRVAEAFGDVVDVWVTVNEPSTTAVAGYAAGVFPPGLHEPARGLRVYATLLKAHARASAVLRRVDGADADGDGTAVQVGIVHIVTFWGAASASPLDATLAAVVDDLANEVVPRALATGRIRLSLPGVLSLDEEVEGLKGSADFLGLNYYRREQLRADLTQATFQRPYLSADADYSDIAWEVFPEGLYRNLVRYAAYGLPLYVSENGIADADDARRPHYLRAHLYAVQLALAHGADVRGYFHWTLTDNFEWHGGYAPRFGLFAVDFADPSLPRTPRPSAEVFRGVAREMGLQPAASPRPGATEAPRQRP
jgi:beta-glucosidase